VLVRIGKEERTPAFQAREIFPEQHLFLLGMARGDKDKGQEENYDGHHHPHGFIIPDPLLSW
jgi:hypothetical protein